MAWRSSGTTNDEMVDKMKRFEVISTPAIETGFRQVDRKFFVPKNQKAMAHADQPLRDGNLHISAPHIYGSVLEALELRPNSSLSFLNVGSGTGYLSCIVASVLGCQSNNYGVDIHAEVVEHARACTERWKSSHKKPVPDIQWIHGNALTIDSGKGEAVVGFDRIYVGSSVGKEDLPKLASLLRAGGILVGPVEDELVKIVRIGSRSSTKVDASSFMMDTDDPNPLPATEFTHQLLSAVRFASLQAGPKMETVLPSTVWNPSIHFHYPDSFRSSCRELLLCSNAPEGQPPVEKPKPTVNAAGLLPRVLWMEILSYTHRDWFVSPESETAFLRRRLLEEQVSAASAHEARLRAEARCQMAEEERDVYRILARRYQMRLEVALQRAGQEYIDSDSDSDSDEEVEEGEGGDEHEAAGRVFLPPVGRVDTAEVATIGLGAILQSIQNQAEGNNDEDEDEVEVDIIVEDNEMSGNDSGGMEEDASFHDMDESSTEMAEHFGSEDEGDSEAGARAMTQSTSDMVVRQPRTVSITNEDL